MRSCLGDAWNGKEDFMSLRPVQKIIQSPERFKAVLDTNFYGVVHLTRAAIPVMRKQRSGCILQISSVGGRLGVGS